MWAIVAVIVRLVCLFDGVLCQFQQYFSYILLVEETGGPGENHRSVAIH